MLDPNKIFPILTNKEEIMLLKYMDKLMKSVISFLEANEKKPIRAIIDELKGKVGILRLEDKWHIRFNSTSPNWLHIVKVTQR